METGLDTDADGTLDDDEVTDEAFVCNGASPVAAGTRVVRTPNDLLALEGVVRIDGDLLIVASSVVRVELPDLAEVSGRVEIGGNEDLAVVSLPSLARVGTSVDIESNSSATRIALPALERVGGHLYLGDNASLESLELATLDRVGGAFIVSTDSAADLGLDGLPGFVGADAYVGDNSGLALLRIGDAFVGGDLTFHGNANLATLVAVGDVFVSQDVYITSNPALSSADAVNFAAATFGAGNAIIGGNAQ